MHPMQWARGVNDIEKQKYVCFQMDKQWFSLFLISSSCSNSTTMCPTGNQTFCPVIGTGWHLVNYLSHIQYRTKWQHAKIWQHLLHFRTLICLRLIFSVISSFHKLLAPFERSQSIQDKLTPISVNPFCAADTYATTNQHLYRALPDLKCSTACTCAALLSINIIKD